MAVVAQIVVESRRYSGWTDPRYPIGYWQAALQVNGDASGGQLAIDLVFQSAIPAFLNSQMYSVERLSITTNDAVDRDMAIKAVNMDGPSNLAFAHQYSVAMNAQDGVGRSAISGGDLTMLPWFLGSQRQAGTTASLSLVTDNVNTITFKFEAEGYRWSSRSVLVDGGPQRPPTGPYRQ